MNRLYATVNTTKQCFHQYYNRQLKQLDESQNLLTVIRKIRKDHSTMCCRYMYEMIKPECMGRDKFEAFCKENGFMSKRYLNQHKTTDSRGVTRFDNLLLNTDVKTINEAWASDITYYQLSDQTCYITFIIDLHSRRIVGHATSTSLHTTNTTLPALKMAIKTRNNIDLNGLIMHSDGGGQYYASCFKRLTNHHEMRNSMCKHPWENPYAERINGVIKNNYLRNKAINNFEQLKKEVDRSVWLYNNEKPHKALKKSTPISFENNIFAQQNIIQTD